MEQDKIMKKLYNYLYNCQNHSHYMWFNKGDESIISFITTESERYKVYTENNFMEILFKKKSMKRCEPYIKLLEHIKKYNISEDVVYYMYIKSHETRKTSQNKMGDVKKIIKRDNKGVVNKGSGGSNVNKIRYPRKARPLHVWKKFYELFPYQAERDNWDGKTSDKMK